MTPSDVSKPCFHDAWFKHGKEHHGATFKYVIYFLIVGKVITSQSYKNTPSNSPQWKEKAPPAKNMEGEKEGIYEWMKWRMAKKKRRKEEYIWIRRSMAWLLASCSRFRFRVLHKATSGPWVAAAADDDDDCDDERLKCQQANPHCPYHIQLHAPWWREPRSGKTSERLHNTSDSPCWHTPSDTYGRRLII